MDCQHCGAPLSAGATTCASCGAAVPPAAGGADQGSQALGDWSQPPPTHPSGSHPSGSPPGAHPSGLSSEVRNWAMASHLSAFLGSFVALAVIGPLIVWLIRREVDGFSEQHAREALNFNLTILLLVVAGVVFSILTVGIGLIVVVPIGLAVGIAWIVLTIIAAVRASEGREYRYPLTIRFVS
jgi:uncharacterized protein